MPKRLDRGGGAPARRYGPQKRGAGDTPPPGKFTPSTVVRRLLYTAPFGIFLAFALASLVAAGMEGLDFAGILLISAWVVVTGCALVAESVVPLRVLYKIPLYMFSTFMIGAICWGIWSWEKDYYLEKIMLEPAHFKLTRNSCDPRDQRFAVVLGTSVDELSGLPSDLITMGGRPLVQLGLREDGKISIKQLTLYDDRHDVIATVNDDVFWTRNDIRKDRPNPYTLVVYDHNNDVALLLVYLNDHVIEIGGIFRNKSFPMIITHGQDGAIAFHPPNRGGVTIRRSCFTDFRVDQTDKLMVIGNIIVE